MDWYPFYPADFRRKTLGLSLAEDGAYRRLIDEYMIQRGPLPDDDASLARIIGVAIDEWMAVAPAVRRYFHTRGGKMFNTRCEREINAQQNLNVRFAKRAQAASFARWNKISGLRPTRMLQGSYKDAGLQKTIDNSKDCILQGSLSDACGVLADATHLSKYLILTSQSENVAPQQEKQAAADDLSGPQVPRVNGSAAPPGRPRGESELEAIVRAKGWLD